MEKANIFISQVGTQMVFTRQKMMQSCLNVYGYLLLTVYPAFRRLLMKRTR